MSSALLNSIPEATAPESQYWYQPYRGTIAFPNAEHAVMPWSSFAKLSVYNKEPPAARWGGKMWKALERGVWFLCWYDSQDDTTGEAIPVRKRLILCPPPPNVGG
jgi:hypothetical protein